MKQNNMYRMVFNQIRVNIDLKNFEFVLISDYLKCWIKRIQQTQYQTAIPGKDNMTQNQIKWFYLSDFKEWHDLTQFDEYGNLYRKMY